MAWKTLDDMDLGGKVVLTRVDLNVPVEDGRVTDATRIERIKPTVDDILTKGGKPVLLAHFGRPKGKVVPEMSLAQIREAVEQVLGVSVAFGDVDQFVDRHRSDPLVAEALGHPDRHREHTLGGRGHGDVRLGLRLVVRTGGGEGGARRRDERTSSLAHSAKAFCMCLRTSANVSISMNKRISKVRHPAPLAEGHGKRYNSISLA